MAIFGRNDHGNPNQAVNGPSFSLAELALNYIQDGVIIIDNNSIIRAINPAAMRMTEVKDSNDVVGVDYSLVLKLKNPDGSNVENEQNEFSNAVKTNQPFESRDYCLFVDNNEKKIPIALSLIIVGDNSGNKIITFRNITKEVEEENAQTEFISTASHEMRTPVASIEGYIGLALNPQTATIDDRARQYLEAAHSSSQHLGRLFKDLLDVTKLDDHQIKANSVPVELTSIVKSYSDEFIPNFKEKQLLYSFGQKAPSVARGKVLSQVIYSYVDVDFLREILNNLIENAIKYTPEGGSVNIAVHGTEDRAIISVSDNGIGIGKEDLKHIFQKFYRVDNSQTRTIGGTGLGLYLVKQRAEAMGGLVWAESRLGEGTTFFVSLPRLSNDEYEKRKIIYSNNIN